jgi:hypothetical protein
LQIEKQVFYFFAFGVSTSVVLDKKRRKTSEETNKHYAASRRAEFLEER